MSKKSVFNNSLYNLVYKGLNTLFPLIVAIYVSRALLPEGIGQVTYAQTIVSYFTLIASLGIPNYGIKAIAKAYDKKQRSETFAELFLINTISTIICIIAYYSFINEIGHFADRKLLFNVVGILLFLNLFNVDWFYQGIEEYRLIAFRGITVKIISFVLIILLIHQPSDYVKYALILCVGTAGNNLFNISVLHRFIDFKFHNLKLSSHFKPILYLLAATIATEVYTMLDTVMLEYFHGPSSVGYYSNAVKVVRTVYNMTIALAVPFYPRIASYISNNEIDNCNQLLEKGVKAISVIAFPASIGLILTAESIVPLLFGYEFLPTARVLQLLGVLIVVFSVAYLFGHVILMAAGQEKKILIATVLGALVNVIINILLIPPLKQNGAAIASIIAELTVTLVLLFFSRKMFSIHIDKNFIFSESIAIIIMIVVILTEQQLINYSSFSVIFIIISAVIAYFLGLLFTKNSVLFGIISKVRK